MRTSAKMSSADRRAAIINAARKVFVEKGFDGTTTRQLAQAAGVSEALLFKHFPTKEAIYSAILTSCFEVEGSRIRERLESLTPSTSSLVSLVEGLVRYLLEGRPDEGGQAFFRLVIRSLMDEGEFARLAIQGGPSLWVRKVAQCIEAAKAAGDMIDTPVDPRMGAWFVHLLVTGIMLHALPSETVINYGVSQEGLLRHVVRFCLLGVGMKEDVIRRCYEEVDTCKV